MEHNSLVIQKINKLHPLLVEPATKIYNKCVKEKIPLHIAWTRRSVEEQDILYKFGRSIPGRLMTVHRGGYSPHNYGLAIDFCLYYRDKLVDWDVAHKYKLLRTHWEKISYFFEQEGWESGWRHQHFEPGHVQNLLGKDLSYYINEQGSQWNL